MTDDTSILIASLANDLGEIADLAAELGDPEKTETARAAVRAWSPGRVARTLAEDLADEADSNVAAA